MICSFDTTGPPLITILAKMIGAFFRRLICDHTDLLVLGRSYRCMDCGCEKGFKELRLKK